MKMTPKMKLTIVAGAMGVFAPQLVSAEEVPTSLGDCKEINDAEARLACYDSIANAPAPQIPELAPAPAPSAPESSAPATPITSTVAPSPSTTSALPPAVEQPPEAPANPEATFGSENLKKNRKEKEKVDRITSPIVDIKANPYGKLTITLANGQVWKQLKGDGKTVRIPRKERDYTATVRRGAIGSYFLRIEELNKAVKVRRVK